MPNPDIPSVPAPELHETSGFAPDLAREVIKPESLDAMIVKLGIPLDKVDPAVKLQILAELGKLHVDGKNKPEENPAILDAVIKQLESFGFTTKQDIHRESYVIDSALDARTADINERLTRAKLPMLSYPSNTGIYAFAVQIVDGKLSYQKDMKSSVVTDPFENHFFRPFNQKADMNQTAQNVYDLGLGKYFQIVQDAPGKPVTAIREGMEDFQHGFVLEDLLRLRDAKGFEYLKQFDVAQSVVTAVKMIDDVHKRAGRGVGELGIQDVMMQVKDGKLVGARLSLPDAVYNKGVEKIDQKALDLIDFIFSIGSAGYQHGQKVEAESNIALVFANYIDKAVLAKVKEMVAAGNPSMNVWSEAKLGFDRIKDKADAEKTIREAVAKGV